jgi:uncharacterized protein (UPF0276 family)
MIPAAGLGLKSQHYAEALAATAPGLWFEVHPENYMSAGGPRLSALAAIRDRHPLSLHGVGLSLAADADPDSRTPGGPQGPGRSLRAVRGLRAPGLVDPSRLPPARPPALPPHPRRPGPHRRQHRPHAGRPGPPGAGREPLAISAADRPRPSETDFLSALVKTTGCGLLVDVNNVFVSAGNLGYSAETYLDALPAAAIGEIHLAGHGADEGGSGLLIDTHGAPIAEPVWTLYRRLIDRVGPRPTLIERDDDIPPFATLMAERDRAQMELEKAMLESAHV